MEKIQNQSHNKQTFLYSLSKMLERASYYGLRGILVLYMVGESLEMSSAEALSIYGWFTLILIFTKIIGALLGDLVIGNRKSIIIGGVIQAVGAFTLCMTSMTGLYIGLFLVLIGGGLFTPNIISNFGRSYLNKTKLLDSGFTLFYLAINLGAFIGVILVGYVGEKYSWNLGFILAGILMLCSIIPILISNENSPEEVVGSELTISRRVVKVLVAIILVGLFWAIYEISGIQIYNLQDKFSEISTLDIPRSMWQSLSSAFTLPISLGAVVLWSYFYSTQFFKLTLGFIFGAISFWVLFLIPDVPTEQHLVLYIVSLFFLGISEIHIGPIVYSVLTEFTNPKYLAIIISLAFIPTRLLSNFVGLFNDELYERPLLAIQIGMVAMTIISVGLVVYGLMGRKLSAVTAPSE